jgi:hypothetical protein
MFVSYINGRSGFLECDAVLLLIGLQHFKGMLGANCPLM